MGLRPLQSRPPILLGRTPPECGYAAGRGCATVPAEAAAVVRAGAPRGITAPTARTDSTGSRRACRNFHIPDLLLWMARRDRTAHRHRPDGGSPGAEF